MNNPRHPSRWAEEFKRQVKRLKEKSRGNWYKYPQPSLRKLKKTGQGDCVAWSKLSREIATKFGLTVFLIVIMHRRDKYGQWSRHQISRVFEKDRMVWNQSNIWLGPSMQVRTSTRLSMANMLRVIRTSLRESARKWHWKSTPFIDDLWYCRGKKVERIIRDGKRVRKIKR